MTTKKNGLAGATTPNQAQSKTIKQTHFNSKFAQQQRLLAALHLGPVDTVTARRELDILHPAGRVRELRHQGHIIDTLMVERPTECGRFHLVGEYVLQPGVGNE
ncbi:MAG: helix-turn-helix domain-containing protein [Desulfurivibrionaceae bacterium]